MFNQKSKKTLRLATLLLISMLSARAGYAVQIYYKSDGALKNIEVSNDTTLRNLSDSIPDFLKRDTNPGEWNVLYHPAMRWESVYDASWRDKLVKELHDTKDMGKVHSPYQLELHALPSLE